MKLNLKGRAAKYGPRLAAVVAGVGAAYIGKETGIVVDPEDLTGVILGTYVILHRAISGKVNPADAAKTVLVEEGKAKVEGGVPGQTDYVRGSEL